MGGKTYTDGRLMLALCNKCADFINIDPSPPPEFIYKSLKYQAARAASSG
jgi:hypothetical protein